MFSPALFFVTSRRYDTPSNGFQDSLGCPTDAQFVIDATQCVVHGPLHYTKAVGHLLDLVSSGKQPQEFHLALGELILNFALVLE
jgi:hypothetical protein